MVYPKIPRKKNRRAPFFVAFFIENWLENWLGKLGVKKKFLDFCLASTHYPFLMVYYG